MAFPLGKGRARHRVMGTGLWVSSVRVCFRETWLFLSSSRDWFLMSRGEVGMFTTSWLVFF
ncbi:hypothetical protein BJX63DRAFT_416261 [Aspergillus granulosus]|uniref:Uncharacterized protein n=1 Tax=Aspergillus granulosus TaxID=176169 RepID=A0ABR4GS52_9EURO